MKEHIILFICGLTILGCSAQKPSNENCPVKSNYYFLDLEFGLDECLVDSRKYYCEDFLGGGDYGYIIRNDIRDIRQDEVDAIKALRIDNRPDQIANLDKFKNLEYLWLSGGVEIPEKIKLLNNLKILHLESYGYKMIPDWIGDLSQLEVFSINLADEITYLSPEIINLSNLEELYLQRFHQLEYQEIDFSKFKKLRKLVLRDNSRDLINESILNCNQLVHLSTRNYHSYLSDLKNLKLLVVQVIHKDQLLTGLSELDKLEEFVVSGSYYRDQIDKEISEIPNLRNLRLEFAGETNINQKKLSFDKLEYLSVRSHYLDAIPIHNMPNLVYLRCLSLKAENKVIVPKEILEYKNLMFLKLAGKGIKEFGFDKTKCKFKIDE